MIYSQAKEAHRTVQIVAKDSDEYARDLWNAITNRGEPRPGSQANAARETLPDEYAALLAADSVAAAYAFGQLALAFGRLPAKTSPLDTRDAARAAWALVGERAALAGDIAHGFGWNLAEAWSVAADVGASGNAAAAARIAKLAGRMFASLRGAKSRKVHGVPSEVYSVEQGRNVDRLLPAETVLMTDALLELPLLQRLATGRAAQYAVRGPQKRSRGPLVIALDESGSMNQNRRDWSKAAALAIARVAKEEGRTVAVIHYSTSRIARALEPAKADSVLAMVRSFLGGGTEIGAALARAAAEVRALATKGAPGADVILVTDGVDPDVASQSAALDDLEKLGARLWTIAIECELDPASPLRARAALYASMNAATMADPSAVTAFAQAASKGAP